jgi:synaptobrevin family protein YKT6
VIISDKDYPMRVAFSLINKVLDEFMSLHPRTSWPSQLPGNQSSANMKFPELPAYLSRFQDPKQGDTIMRVQQELGELEK